MFTVQSKSSLVAVTKHTLSVKEVQLGGIPQRKIVQMFAVLIGPIYTSHNSLGLLRFI